MATAYGFAKYLLENSPAKKSSAEVTLYNAFRSLNKKDSPMERKDLIQVLKVLLGFPQWRNKGEELSLCFNKYFQSYIAQESVQMEIPKLEELQIIEVKNKKNLSMALQSYFSRKFPDAKIKCASFQTSDILVMVLRSSGELSVHHCTNELVLMDGLLSPLMEGFSLHYDKNLKLIHNTDQMALLKPFRRVKFKLGEDLVRITETQGYSMKHLVPKEFHSVEELPELYYHIKAIESRFIHKSSDPLYLSLTRELELSIEKLAEDPIQFKAKALDCYQRGKNAFENIFSDDRLLHLLLKELAMMIASDRAKSWDEPEKESKEEWLKVQKERPLDSTNLLPIVE